MAPITTQAYVARPKNQLALETVRYPKIGADEIVLEVVAASVCHSDVRAAAGNFHLSPPMIIGHEAAGYVKEVGKAVTYVKPGDAVVTSYSSCGKCRQCMSGKQAYCDLINDLNFRGRRLNGDVAAVDEKGETLNALFFGQSSMSKLALVREDSCVKVECSKSDLKLFASLGCGIQTGAGAVMYVE